MSILHDRLAEQIPAMRDELKTLVAEHGDRTVDTVIVSQILGGMRGIKSLICDTSRVEPDDGLLIRGRPILSLKDSWPEATFHLLLTGQEAADEDVRAIGREMDARAGLPSWIWTTVKSLPADSHPMAMLTSALLALEHDSVFRREYDAGAAKDVYWRAMLEDALTLLPRITELAAGIYRIRYGKGDPIPWTKGRDLGANYANMLGVSDADTFASLMRLYLTFHSDHGGGNVSNFTCLTVGSALSDAYYAVAAGLSGLAGPLHGLANQECLKWILDVMKRYGGKPTPDQMREAAWDTLRSGRVIPGYGHGVLRATDPRFTGLFEWGREHLADDPVFGTVAVAFETVPGVLKEHGKAKNPWPNVDAGSGSLLYHHGLTEFSYYTVLFAVSRAMGMLAQLTLNRALSMPITRPKAVERSWLRVAVGSTE